MGYLVFNVFCLLYVLWDGYRRETSKLWAWALGVAVAAFLVLPFYFSKRPLREDEVRTGGTSWNVLRNFAIFWTLMMIFVAFSAAGGAGEVMQGAQSDAEKAGAAIGAGLGLTMIGCMWFVPMVGGLVLGLFLKKDVREEGPTGPLAENKDEKNSDE